MTDYGHPITFGLSLYPSVDQLPRDEAARPGGRRRRPRLPGHPGPRLQPRVPRRLDAHQLPGCRDRPHLVRPGRRGPPAPATDDPRQGRSVSQRPERRSDRPWRRRWRERRGHRGDGRHAAQRTARWSRSPTRPCGSCGVHWRVASSSSAAISMPSAATKPARCHRRRSRSGWAARGRRMLAVTGRSSDGWVSPLSTYTPPSAVPSRQQLIDEAARSAGRDPAVVRRIYNVVGAIGAGRSGPGLTVDVQSWVDALTGWSVELGFDTFIFWPMTAPLAQLEVFASLVVPGVRQRVSERRGPAVISTAPPASGHDGRPAGRHERCRLRARSTGRPRRADLAVVDASHRMAGGSISVVARDAATSDAATRRHPSTRGNTPPTAGHPIVHELRAWRGLVLGLRSRGVRRGSSPRSAATPSARPARTGTGRPRASRLAIAFALMGCEEPSAPSPAHRAWLIHSLGGLARRVFQRGSRPDRAGTPCPRRSVDLDEPGVLEHRDGWAISASGRRVVPEASAL